MKKPKLHQSPYCSSSCNWRPWNTDLNVTFGVLRDVLRRGGCPNEEGCWDEPRPANGGTGLNEGTGNCETGRQIVISIHHMKENQYEAILYVDHRCFTCALGMAGAGFCPGV